MTGYDDALGTLGSAVGPEVTGEYMAVMVEEGDADIATTIIEGCGGTVTGVNDHEAGHTITFEV
jgi:hypothetical protein